MYCGSCQYNVFLSVLNEVGKHILYSTVLAQKRRDCRIQLFSSLVKKSILIF